METNKDVLSAYRQARDEKILQDFGRNFDKRYTTESNWSIGFILFLLAMVGMSIFTAAVFMGWI